MESDYSTLGKKKMKKKLNGDRMSVGANLDHLDEDKQVTSDPDENRRRRTLKLIKKDNSWGFTLQTYGIKHKKTNEIEVMTYVDYVELGRAAWMAGMRRGDVILAINGEKVGEATHRQLVHKIRQAGNTLRLVVLFEDCCRKVELHDRFIRLKMVLRNKQEELHELEKQEIMILDRHFQSKGINRFEELRQSIISRASSDSSSWDAYSLISAPSYLAPTSQFSRWSSVSSMRSFNIGDNSSSITGDTSSFAENYCEDSLDFIDGESDSDGISVNLSNVCQNCDTENDVTGSSGIVSKIEPVSITVTDCSEANDVDDHLSSTQEIYSKDTDDVFETVAETSLSQASAISVASDKSDDTLTNQSNVSEAKGVSLPYETLKHSIPEIITFHADDFKLVYINEKDEVTPL